MANLQRFWFSSRSDLALSFNGWVNENGKVLALAGNDIILGTGGIVGILNTASPSASGSTLNTGLGNDIIQGIGRDFGIKNANGSMIDTDGGDDILVATATLPGSQGLFNSASAISTGDGNDVITGTGGNTGIGINNSSDSTIDTGIGNDVVTGRAGEGGVDIKNDGIISTGDGNDVVDAFSKGFAGNGSVSLGTGDDEIKGFGSGTFDGGGGNKDTLTFASGKYLISSLKDGFYAITLDGDPSSNAMKVAGFEQFGAGAINSNFADAAEAGFVTFV